MGIGLAILGLSLVFDPWSEERYERAIRETVRLNNDFYVYLNQLIEMNEEIGWFLFFSAFLIMNRYE